MDKKGNVATFSRIGSEFLVFSLILVGLLTMKHAVDKRRRWWIRLETRQRRRDGLSGAGSGRAARALLVEHGRHDERRDAPAAPRAQQRRPVRRLALVQDPRPTVRTFPTFSLVALNFTAFL